MSERVETPVGYVVWFTRNRSYLSTIGWQSGAPTLANAKLFTSEHEANSAAEKFSYLARDENKPEPFVVNPVGLRLLGEYS